MANFLTRFFHSISEGLHNMFTKDIGIDLGTANTLSPPCRCAGR